ncbi:PadR family transcriptional regulator [Clostridium sp. KNHs216]|uniref:PadR family transcriptional regulator n=1 Tax=Clostridium sp. KNHs216 TaxID=1550235 RepID=UPI0011513B1A|nr:PadR family transcriptional regulator [Clostridium sp. KNHs216]TQI67319.1 PadR family transcriptional regulator PadR [Clostridium sp. KNHs216]
MFDKSQLMRGTLEGCILKIISLKVTYGYEIMEKLRSFGFDEVKEGTIYPLLVRLENKSYITSEFRSSPLGPNRKYYSTTSEGSRYLHDFEEYWGCISISVNKILNLEAM